MPALHPSSECFQTTRLRSVEEDYGVDVTYHIQLPEELLDPFTKAVTDLTNGQAIVEQVG